ncbi:MAG TPA: superoxide dismutase, partial [Chloroflexota bacterium]|nr:superoxide dismutase [Chloroflexota bacterium]
KPLKPSTLTMQGISRRTMEEHYKLYEGYCNKANEIRQKLQSVNLSTANQTYSEIRELKVELSFALGGAINHEIYFANLGGGGGPASGRVAELINRDFGSFDSWAADLRATGLAARGWAWLALDLATGHLFNFIGDAQNTYPIWNCSPILALDTYEHAYYLDYAVNRGAYIDVYFQNIDWEDVNRRLATAEKMYHAASGGQAATYQAV